MPSAQLTPLIAAALATTLGGSAIVGTRYIIGETDPLTLAFLRYAIAAACLAPFIVFSKDRSLEKQDVLPVAGLGFLYFGMHPWAFTASLELITAAHGALVISLTPMLTLALSAAVRYEKITGRKFLGMIVALSGVFIALSENAFQEELGEQYWLGGSLMFIAACIGATYNVISRPYLKRYSATTVVSYGMLAGAGSLFVLVLFIEDFANHLPVFDATGWAVVIYIGAFGAALAFYLLLWALGRSTPARIAVFLALNPLAAMLLGGVLLDEPVTVFTVTGFILVCIGIVVVNWAPSSEIPNEKLAVK